MATQHPRPLSCRFLTLAPCILQAICPLCIEELDQTDLTFEPCPCG